MVHGVVARVVNGCELPSSSPVQCNRQGKPESNKAESGLYGVWDHHRTQPIREG